MAEGLLDTALFAAGAALLAAAVRWWRPALPRPWAAGHALLTFAFFAVPLVTPLAHLPVDIPYLWRPWSETVTEEPEVDNRLLGDIPLQMLPWRTLVRERLLDLEAPLWAHEMGTGQPLLGNAQSAPFAPLHLGTLPLPPMRGLTVAAAWQVLLGLLLTHALVLALAATGEPARRPDWRVQAGAATGAVAFALSAYAVAWLYHPLSMVAMWLPGVVLGIVALHRGERWAVPGLVVSALGLAVSGHPETTMHTAVLAAGLGLALWVRGPGVGRGRFAARAGGAVLVTACFAAPVLLPVVEVLPSSQRFNVLRLGGPGAIAPPDLRPAVFLPLVDPLVFGTPRDGDWSGPANFNEYCTHYAGAAALAAALAGVLALWRRRRWPAAVLGSGLAALLVAVKTPVLYPLFDALPVLGDAAHGRMRLFWVLAVAVVAGAAAPRLAERPAGRWAGVAALLGAGAVLALAPPPGGSLHQRLWWVVALAGLAAATASLAIPRLRRAFPAMLLAVVAADLFTLGVRYHALVPPGRQLEPPPALAWLMERQEEEAPFRVLAASGGMPANLAAVYGLWDPRSNDPMAPHGASRLVGRRLSAGRWRLGRPLFVSPAADLPTLRMLGVRYFLTPHRHRLAPPWREVLDDVGGRVWRLDDPLPLFFVPGRVRPVEDEARALAITLRNRDFAAVTVFDEPEPAAGPRARAQEGDVWLREVRPNGFEVVSESRAGALVASSVSSVPGWRAAIDGEPSPLVTVNTGFLGIRVPPGVHRVELDYAPAGWRWGVGLFGGALLGLAIGGLMRFAGRRSAGSGAPARSP
jgi:hypothetical protein